MHTHCQDVDLMLVWQLEYRKVTLLQSKYFLVALFAFVKLLGRGYLSSSKPLELTCSPFQH